VSQRSDEEPSSFSTDRAAGSEDLGGLGKLALVDLASGGLTPVDQPDTDIMVGLTEVKADGSSVFLTGDSLRARYRESLREAKLAKPGAIERYDFSRFSFVARRIAKGSRLRLMIAPMNSMYAEKNYNTGGVVAAESGKDARKVTVTLYHDSARPSALTVPIAAASSVAAK